MVSRVKKIFGKDKELKPVVEGEYGVLEPVVGSVQRKPQVKKMTVSELIIETGKHVNECEYTNVVSVYKDGRVLVFS